MAGGDKRRSGRRRRHRTVAAVAVVLLLGAGFGPSAGLALDAGDSSDGSVVSAALSSISGPATGSDGDEWSRAVAPTSAPNGTSATGGSGPTNRRKTSERTVSTTTPFRSSTTSASGPTSNTASTTTPERTTRTTTNRGAAPTTERPSRQTTGRPSRQTTGRSPPTTERSSRQTASEGNAGESASGPSAPSESPGDTPTTSTASGSPPNGTAGSDHPGAEASNGVENGSESAEGGQTVHETSRRAGVGSGSQRDAPGENRTGHPANRTGHPADAPDWLGNETVTFGNRTGHSNATADRRADVTTPGPNATRPPRPEVNVTVENATANAPVSVNVSASADPDGDVSFSSVNVTPARDGRFTLNVTASGDPIPGKTPSTDLGNGTRPLGYLSVDHSIEDRNISNVTFTFRVRTDRLDAAERDELVLYRYHGGTWNELPTTLVRTTDRHYVYRVRSPGLSEFAAGLQHAEFNVTDATVTDANLSVGDTLEVRVRIANRGEADGTFTATLALDGEAVARHRVTIAAGGMRQATFEEALTEPGTYEVYVNEHRVGEVTVTGPTDGRATAAASTGATSNDAQSTGAESGPHETSSNATRRVDNTASAGTMSALATWAVTLLAWVGVGRRW